MNRVPASNPFATRYVRPGAMPYVFADGESAEGVVERLAAGRWRGQIVGPHGTGKSTLLAALDGPLRRAGRTPYTIALRDRQRRLPSGWSADVRQAGADLVVIDGYEQLAWASRVLVALRCRASGWGLLVTAHADVGLPMVARTGADLQSAEQLVARLTAGTRGIDAQTLGECFADSQGNIREMLFALYDRWEAARPAKRE
jgi:hypothetical protein